MTDIISFRTLAARYLKKRDRYDEDVLSEMVLYALEREGKPTSLRYAYLNALDKISRRQMINGERTHERALQCGLADDAALADPAAPTPEQYLADIQQTAARLAYKLPKQGMLRAMSLLRFKHGYTIGEIAALFGVSATQVAALTGTRDRPTIIGLGSEEQRYFDASLTLGVQWIKF